VSGGRFQPDQDKLIITFEGLINMPINSMGFNHIAAALAVVLHWLNPGKQSNAPSIYPHARRDTLLRQNTIALGVIVLCFNSKP
jgi:hypothetical protein